MSSPIRNVHVFRRNVSSPSIYQESPAVGDVYEEFVEYYDTQNSPPSFCGRDKTGRSYEFVDRISIEMVQDDPTMLMRAFALYNLKDATFYRFRSL